MRKVFFAGGLLIFLYGVSLGLVRDDSVGSGFWPCLLGAGFLLSSFSLPRQKFSVPLKPEIFHFFLAACILWVLLLLPLGWIAASALSFLLLCRAAHNSLNESLLMTAGLLFCLWLGFSLFLNYPLPTGIIF